MITALLTAAAFTTPFGIGHIDNHGNVPHAVAITEQGQTVSQAIPPRTMLWDRAECRWLTDLHVTSYKAHQPHTYKSERMHWEQDRTVQRFGSVTFNGMEIANYSRTRWANVRFSIITGC